MIRSPGHWSLAPQSKVELAQHFGHSSYAEAWRQMWGPLAHDSPLHPLSPTGTWEHGFRSQLIKGTCLKETGKLGHTKWSKKWDNLEGEAWTLIRSRYFSLQEKGLGCRVSGLWFWLYPLWKDQMLPWRNLSGFWQADVMGVGGYLRNPEWGRVQIQNVTPLSPEEKQVVDKLYYLGWPAIQVCPWISWF